MVNGILGDMEDIDSSLPSFQIYQKVSIFFKVTAITILISTCQKYLCFK